MTRASDTAAPRFSVLLPTHDGERTLGFAIGSVLAQTEPSFELLVVGDGCSDRSQAIAEGFGDARVRFFDLPKGPGFGYANRNTVLREARGTYVAFMAHDDLWLHDHLARLHGELSRPGITLAHSRPLWVMPRGLCAPLTFNLRDPQTLADFLGMHDNKLPASCFAYASACTDRHGAWDASLPASADWELWARLIRGEGVGALGYVAEPTCLHFRAHWRSDANAGPHTLAIWQALHALPDGVPDALKLEVSAAKSEQESVWRAIEQSPEAWTRRLRDAVTVATDRRVNDADAVLLGLMREGGEAGRDPVQLMASIAQFSRLRERTLDTPAWALAQKLQAWKARVAPEGSRRQRALQRISRRLRRR